MLSIEEVNEVIKDQRFVDMCRENTPFMNQAGVVIQTMILQTAIGNILGQEINTLSAIGAAFLLGMVCERDGWCIDELVEPGNIT